MLSWSDLPPVVDSCQSWGYKSTLFAFLLSYLHDAVFLEVVDVVESQIGLQRWYRNTDCLARGDRIRIEVIPSERRRTECLLVVEDVAKVWLLENWLSLYVLRAIVLWSRPCCVVWRQLLLVLPSSWWSILRDAHLHLILDIWLNMWVLSHMSCSQRRIDLLVTSLVIPSIRIRIIRRRMLVPASWSFNGYRYYLVLQILAILNYRMLFGCFMLLLLENIVSLVRFWCLIIHNLICLLISKVSFELLLLVYHFSSFRACSLTALRFHTAAKDAGTLLHDIFRLEIDFTCRGWVIVALKGTLLKHLICRSPSKKGGFAIRILSESFS